MISRLQELQSAMGGGRGGEQRVTTELSKCNWGEGHFRQEEPKRQFSSVQ